MAAFSVCISKINFRLEKDNEPFIRMRAESSAFVQQSFTSRLVSSFFVSDANDILATPIPIFSDAANRQAAQLLSTYHDESHAGHM